MATEPTLRLNINFVAYIHTYIDMFAYSSP